MHNLATLYHSVHVHTNKKPFNELIKHTLQTNWANGWCVEASLVSSPDPTLLRRNGLVSQVKFLGLAHAFATMNLATVKTFCGQPAQKRYGHSNGDDQNLML